MAIKKKIVQTVGGQSGDDFGQTKGEDKKVLLTKEGLKKLREELDYLQNIRRKEVAKRLQEAISYGDLSENSEYEDAKNEQAFVEGRILEIEEKIKNAKVIVESHKKTAVVQVGTSVLLRRLDRSQKEDRYTVVGSTEVDPLKKMISNESPMGKAIIGKKTGDTVDVNVPAGMVKYKIVSLK